MAIIWPARYRMKMKKVGYFITVFLCESDGLYYIEGGGKVTRNWAVRYRAKMKKSRMFYHGVCL